jgi:hypothetical protein
MILLYFTFFWPPNVIMNIHVWYSVLYMWPGLNGPCQGTSEPVVKTVDTVLPLQSIKGGPGCSVVLGQTPTSLVDRGLGLASLLP